MSPRSARTSRSGEVPRSGIDVPATLSVRGLVAIVAVAAFASALGIAIIDRRFETRDFEIETHRLQELATVRRDESKRLTAEVGQLTRGERLRETAVNVLGMRDPAPSEIGHVTISPEGAARWQGASRAARAGLAEEVRIQAAYQFGEEN